MSLDNFIRHILSEITKQSPALIVIGLVSVGFLFLIFKYLQTRDKEQQVLFHEAMLTIKENSKVLGQVQSLLQHLLFSSSRSLGSQERSEGRDDSRDTISKS